MPYLLQELEEIQELPHPHLPEVLQVLRSSQVDVMTIKLPIYQLAIVDILPHHSSTMHKNPIHFFSNHRISSLQGLPFKAQRIKEQTPVHNTPIRTYCHTSLQPPNSRKRVISLSKSTIYIIYLQRHFLETRICLTFSLFSCFKFSNILPFILNQVSNSLNIF